MHEYSIVQNLLDLCEQNAVANGATKIHKVIVGIGEMSSVEPSLLKTAFDTFKQDTIADSAVMDIQRLPLKAECFDCGADFVPTMFNFICPNCSSPNTKLVSGDELLLLSLEIE